MAVCLFFSEYYFSLPNLERDFFLRRRMDSKGFLPISLIASFHRVQALTTDINLIKEVNTDPSLLTCLIFSTHTWYDHLQFVLYQVFVCLYRRWRTVRLWSWWMSRSVGKRSRSSGPSRHSLWTPREPISPSSSTAQSSSRDRRSPPSAQVLMSSFHSLNITFCYTSHCSVSLSICWCVAFSYRQSFATPATSILIHVLLYAPLAYYNSVGKLKLCYTY